MRLYAKLQLARSEEDIKDAYIQALGLKDYSKNLYEAKAVLAAGNMLWQAYFAHTDVRSVRDELKLNRVDVGWYQLRRPLQARNASGDLRL